MDGLEDDFDRGLKNRREVLGDEWVDRATGGANGFNADFQALITRYAWHDVWGRPGLDRLNRRLLVLGMTMGLARWEEFELHCRAAVRGGVPIDAIRETLIQGAVYCGVPAANTAFKITTQILRDEGLLPPPAPLVPGVRVQRHHTFSAPQLQVAVQGAAEGVPVVLSHALGLDHTMWDDLAAALAPHHPVLRWDHRGHGGSAVPPGPYTLDDLVDDAARLVREWGRGPVVFIGLSLGGMVGQGLAIRHPALVRGLVLAHTTAAYPAEAASTWAQRIAAVEAGGMAAVADGVLQRFLHDGFRAAQPAVAARVLERLRRTSAAGYVACCHAAAAVKWAGDLHRIACPTTVISGGRDIGAPPAMGRAIADAVPGARFELIDEASHLGVLEAPAAFGAAVSALLARVA